MKFEDLLEVLDSDEQLSVTDEWADEVYECTVEEFREEKLLLDLRVCRIYTRITIDDERSSILCNKKALTTEIDVTLCNDEH